MENKTELMQLRHPDYDRELTELVRSNLSPKAFREKLLDYHENDIAAAGVAQLRKFGARNAPPRRAAADLPRA